MPSLPFRKKDQTLSPYRLASDQALVASCLAGEETAWDALIDRYAALIFSLCRRMGLSQADAEDVFQDVCIILFNHLESVRDTARLSGWLIATTRREVWKAARKKNVTLASELGESEWEMEGASGLHPQKETGDPEQEMLALAEQQLMREAVQRLPDRCRNLLLHLYAAADPLSYQDLSAKFSLPIGSIGPTRARCLQSLRKILQELGY